MFVCGGLAAVVGALEGALIGLVLTSRSDPSTLIFAVALDRCLLFGLAGAIFGAVAGTIAWCLRSRKKR
jgi:hypothetical protein